MNRISPPVALRLLLRVLGTTLRRCWWILAMLVVLTAGVLSIAQGREFFIDVTTFTNLLAFLIVTLVFAFLLAVVAAWLATARGSETGRAPIANAVRHASGTSGRGGICARMVSGSFAGT